MLDERTAYLNDADYALAVYRELDALLSQKRTAWKKYKGKEYITDKIEEEAAIIKIAQNLIAPQTA